jgi:hypothetical protein
MHAKTILAKRQVPNRCWANRLIDLRAHPDAVRGRRRQNRQGRDPESFRRMSRSDKQSLGWGAGAGAEGQEPMGLPCIVQAAGRPFPPPRARPVISGVVDIVGYAPVFSAASTGGYRLGESGTFAQRLGSSYLGHSIW